MGSEQVYTLDPFAALVLNVGRRDGWAIEACYDFNDEVRVDTRNTMTGEWIGGLPFERLTVQLLERAAGAD